MSKIIGANCAKVIEDDKKKSASRSSSPIDLVGIRTKSAHSYMSRTQAQLTTSIMSQRGSRPNNTMATTI
jgi:hypothetical protein